MSENKIKEIWVKAQYVALNSKIMTFHYKNIF